MAAYEEQQQKRNKHTSKTLLVDGLRSPVRVQLMGLRSGAPNRSNQFFLLLLHCVLLGSQSLFLRRTELWLCGQEDDDFFDPGESVVVLDTPFGIQPPP